MKNVYFVRHGETALNIDNRYNAPDTPLNELGLRQARFVADRFAHIPIDIIVTSTMMRAMETAETVRSRIGAKVASSDLLCEKKFPSELIGKPIDAPEVLEYKEEYQKHNEEENWHFSDEENYFDLRRRAVEAVNFLRELPEGNIAVVTHGTFLRMLIAVMMHGADVTHADFRKFYDFVITRNTGITWCMLEDDGVWRMLTWNDHAHLG